MTTQTTDLSGILVALPTHFTADGATIDVEAFRDHVDHLIDSGVHGLVPGGSTGEFTVLSAEEWRQLIELSVKVADGRVPVVAGIGGLSTANAVDSAAFAAQVGASALMVVAPFYDSPTLDELKAHLAAIHDASGLPIVYYNIPSATGLHLSAAEIASLAEVPGVAYLKDTSGDAVSLTELLVSHGDRITAFNGWDTLTFYGLAAGAKGSVWGATNLLPELSAQLWDAVAVRGDLEEGRALWSKIWPVCDFLEQQHYAASIKTGLELLGRSAGPVRAPFNLLEGERRDTLAQLLRDAGCSVA